MPLLVVRHSKILSISHPSARIQNHARHCELPGVVPSRLRQATAHDFLSLAGARAMEESVVCLFLLLFPMLLKFPSPLPRLYTGPTELAPLHRNSSEAQEILFLF